MSGQVAAYIANGKVVTGSSHFFALQKLNEEQKNGPLISGFLDTETNIFQDDCGGNPRLLKRIYLVRHAEAEGQNFDCPLTENGRLQAKQAALFILNKINLKEVKCFSSTATRCQETSAIFEKEFNLKIDPLETLLGRNEKENELDYFNRLNQVLLQLPPKSLLISHTDLIINITMLAIMSQDKNNWPAIENCSITQINNNRLIWMAKEYEKRTEY